MGVGLTQQVTGLVESAQPFGERCLVQKFRKRTLRQGVGTPWKGRRKYRSAPSRMGMFGSPTPGERSMHLPYQPRTIQYEMMCVQNSSAKRDPGFIVTNDNFDEPRRKTVDGEKDRVQR